MMKSLVKMAVSYAVAGAAIQAGQDLWVNRAHIKIKAKKVVKAVKSELSKKESK